MNNIVCNDVDEIQKRVISDLLVKGQTSYPRGQEIQELCGYTIHLNNPRNRIIYNPARKFSLTFALGEFLWYLSGRDDLNTMLYYNKKYNLYSDDNETLHGAYGKRIFYKDNFSSQFENVINKLKSDNDSRQAIIFICEASDIKCVTKDVPCTCSLQYIIRDGYLNCITYMRSNDIILGTAYDIFSFTMIQELLARILGVKLGWYKHIVGSMHIYKEFYEKGQEILNCSNYTKYAMDEMPNETINEFKKLLIKEINIRENRSEILNGCSTAYFRDLENILIYVNAKKKKDIELQKKIHNALPLKYNSVLY